MTTGNLNLFNGLYSKMNYLGQKQQVIAQNVANADTPNYRALEIKEPNFKRVLGDIQRSNRIPLDGGRVSGPDMKVTNGSHMERNGQVLGNSRGDFRESVNRDTYEVAPSNNAVVIEEQLILATEVAADHRMMTNIHEKYLNMMRAAIGQNR